MKITKKQLEKLVLEELESSLVDEGIFNTLGRGAGKIAGAFSDLKKGYQQGKSEGDPARLAADKKMAQVALFIQAAERELRDEILATDLGDKLFQSQMVAEQYGEQQLLQMMKRKGITPQQVDQFIAAMQKIPKAKEFLKLAGLGGATPAAAGQQPTATQPAPETSGEPVAMQGPPEPPRGEDVPEPVASGEEAKRKVKEKLKLVSNDQFRSAYDRMINDVNEMPDIDDQAKQEVVNKLAADKRKNKRQLTDLAKNLLDPAIDALEESKQSNRWQKLAGILKD